MFSLPAGRVTGSLAGDAQSMADISADDKTGRNVPVPDELAAVREQMKALEAREADLRRLLIANPDLRTGAAWLAEVKTVAQDRTDLRELRACHPDIVEQFTFPQETIRVVLSGITEDGEIIHARRVRAIKEAS